MGRIWLLWGCVLGFFTVALGAFGAHALKALVEPDKMEVLHTANQYMAYHAFALLALGLWNHWEKWSGTLLAGLCFLLGVILFSGSLYVYVLMDVREAAMITPLGGSLFLLGWIFFAIAVVRTKNNII